ncbi:MAG: hypothetical protein LBU91_04275 [Bacteroidales bacterium]|jgi:hypothetical protein|nr:hypothetical protein [Bacteroidales bacterium]
MQKKQNKIWFHRNEWDSDNAKKLLEEKCLAIGFASFYEAAEEICRKRGDIYNICAKITKKKPNIYLEDFTRTMVKGDWVIVPTFPKRNQFSIYELTEDCARPISQLRGSNSAELGFFRNVRVVVYGATSTWPVKEWNRRGKRTSRKNAK